MHPLLVLYLRNSSTDFLCENLKFVDYLFESIQVILGTKTIDEQLCFISDLKRNIVNCKNNSMVDYVEYSEMLLKESIKTIGAQVPRQNPAFAEMAAKDHFEYLKFFCQLMKEWGLEAGLSELINKQKEICGQMIDQMGADLSPKEISELWPLYSSIGKVKLVYKPEYEPEPVVPRSDFERLFGEILKEIAAEKQNEVLV